MLTKFIKREMESILFDEETEIDETLLYKKKYRDNLGRKRKIHLWVFCIKGRQTNKFVLYLLQKRTKESLFGKILQHIGHASTIYSDCYSAYVNNRTIPKESYLEKLGYNHLFVNHKIQFVSSLLENVHINKIERMWKNIKKFISISTPKIFIEESIFKYYFKQNYSYEKQLEILLNLMKKN